MRNIKTLVILGVITLIIAVVALLSREKPSDIAGSGELLFTDLLAKVNDAGELKILHQNKTVTIVNKEGNWIVSEKANYPAAGEKVRQYIIGLARLKRLEPKTSNPERYAKLGLEDVTVEEAKSTHVMIMNTSGEKLAELIIGDRRPAKADPSYNELFVRLLDDPQAWLVEGTLPNYQEGTDWLDNEILKLARDRVKAVKVTHADGEAIVVQKSDPTANDYQIADIPEGAKPKSAYTANSIANTFADLSLDDVKKEADIDFNKETATSAELATFDGLKVKMETVESGEEKYARFRASFDATVSETNEKEKQTKEDAEGKDDSKQPTSLKKPDEVKKEVEKLNSRWQGWAYKLPDYRVTSIAKRMDDLVEYEKTEEESEESTAEASSVDEQAANEE